MIAPRLREQRRPPAPPDRQPPRRGRRLLTFHICRICRRPASGSRAPARRGLVRSARALAAAALLALSGALALPAAANAQEIALVSNMSESGTQVTFVQPVGFQLGGIEFGETRISQRFTTGPNTAGYSLQSVVLNLGTNLGSGSVVQVAIHEESSGNPGTLLGVLDNPADPFGDNPAAAGNRTFSAPSALSLDANTNYWVVLRDTTSATGANNYRVRLTASNNETTTHGFSISNGHQAGTPGNWSENTLSVVKMEVRGTLAPPRVTSVVVASAPQSGDTYRSYETIVFTVTFSEPVRVTPGRLRLKVGLDNPGGASGSTVEAVFSGLSQSQRPTADTPQAQVARHLHFEYKVQLFDHDVDGVRIGANALRLASGARIRSEGGGDAELDHAALGPQSDHKVDGTADVPMIERIEVVSTPRLRSKGTTTRDTYGEGENIRIEVRFDQPVVVEGEPTFAFEVGNPCLAVCEAYYESGSGTDTLVFAYLVLEVDIDRNGIAIRGNPIEVVYGDSISNAADQEAHLSSKGKGTQRGHKVDGSRAAPSYLSVEDAEAHEADGEMEFTVRLEPHGLGIVTVDYATADGTGSKAARAGSDYTETSGTLTFNSLKTERTVSVPIMDDAHEDDGETFTLTLSNPDGAKLRSGDGEATGTIRNSEIQPLTATFEDVPSAHDGSAFTFRMAFSEDIGISYRALREDALAVTGGRVTRGARVDDRRDLFEMTVRPESDDDVTITLQAGRECAVSGAICTKGENRRQLTNTPAATVAGPAVESGPAGLTARFVGLPAEHRGEGGFRFRVAFSEDIGISFRSLREDAFTVTGGRVTGGKRVDGRRDLFEMTVRPTSVGDVTITLLAGRACAVSGAICTKGEPRRKLTNTISATVGGPVSVAVADARAREGTDETIDFAVTLSRAAAAPVAVAYATADGSATAGSDYTARKGQLTFDPGETAKTVSVAVLDDAHDEGAETLTLRLSAASGAVIADGVATGTIENTDHMPRAWMVRFGRTVGSHVVDALGERLEGGAPSHVTVGGIRLTGAPGVVPEADTDDPFGLPEWATKIHREEAARTLTRDDLLLRSAFHLSSGGGEAAEPAFTTWGRVSMSGFEAEVDDVTMDGDVTTGHIGFDAEWERVLAGVMVSQSTGEGDYRLSAEQGGDAGSVKSSLTGVYPYARLALSGRMSAWALAGAGSGELTLTQEGGKPMPTDIAMRMGAVGVKGQVLDGTGASGVALNVKSDAMWVGTKSERTHDMVATEGDVTRLRLIVEGERSFEAASGATFTPSAQLGVRHDGGDAETGTGVEVGAGLRYTVGAVTIEAQARTLLAHEASGYEEWGMSGAVRVTPGASGRGLTLSIAPAWGQTGSAAERLWSAHDASALGSDSEFEPESRLDMDVGYGFGLPGNRGVLTPYAGMTLGDARARTVRTGTRWQLGTDAVLGLETTRQTSDAGETDNRLMLRAALRF